MYTINVTDELGETRKVEYELGLSLMEVLKDAGYEQVLAMCGGCCSCATCHVHLDDANADNLPTVEEDEAMLLALTDNYQADQSRLSCQIELAEEHANLAVTLIALD